MLKNSQTDFKDLAVRYPKILKVCMDIFNIMHERLSDWVLI